MVNAPDPIRAATLHSMLACSASRSIRCHGWTDTIPSGCRSSAAPSRSSRSDAGSTSASTNNSTGAVVDPTPAAQAFGLPSHPSASGGASTTVAPHAVATAAVSSVEWSSTTTSSSPARNCPAMTGSRFASAWASLRAGTITAIGARERPSRCDRTLAAAGLARAAPSRSPIRRRTRRGRSDSSVHHHRIGLIIETIM